MTWSRMLLLLDVLKETILGMARTPGGGGEERQSLILAILRYVRPPPPPHRVGFLCRFGLKTRIRFAHFRLESGVVFEKTSECMNVFIVSILNE